MLPDQVSNPGPLTYKSGALPIALRGPAGMFDNLQFLSMNTIDANDRISLVGNPNHLAFVGIELHLPPVLPYLKLVQTFL